MIAREQDAHATAAGCAVVLDVDNTLTPPRRPLEHEMADVLKRLTVPFCLGAGSDLGIITEQFLEPFREFGYRSVFDAFLCNGATRYRCDLRDGIRTTLVRGFALREHVGPERFEKLLAIIWGVVRADEFQLPPPMRVIGDQVVDRVSMVNVAPIGRPRERLTEGTHANRDAFTEYDRRTGYRRRMRARLTEALAEFEPDGLHVALGGETSFDIVVRGNDKSYPLQTLLDEGFSRVWYIGDALFEGGNDEAVLQYIERWPGPTVCPVAAIRVNGWPDTKAALEGLGLVGDPKP